MHSHFTSVDTSLVGRTFRRPNGKVEYEVIAKYLVPIHRGQVVSEYTCRTQNGIRFVPGSQLKRMVDITLNPEWH